MHAEHYYLSPLQSFTGERLASIPWTFATNPEENTFAAFEDTHNSLPLSGIGAKKILGVCLLKMCHPFNK